MKKLLNVFLSVSIAVSLLTGCGGTAPAGTGSQSAVEETEEAVKAEEAEKPAEEAEEAAENEQPVMEFPEAGETAEASEDEEFLLQADLPTLPVDELFFTEESEELEELTEEEAEEMDRVRREFTPPADCLLTNKAESYYYYEHMNKDAQALYDAIYMCAMYPDVEDYSAVAYISFDPYADLDDFWTMWQAVKRAVVYDHPELFWMYSDIIAKMRVLSMKNQVGDSFEVICHFEEPYEDFKEVMPKFNAAAEKFLEDIDLSASDAEIALEIHDKLIRVARYNSLCYGSEYGRDNLAHTAYAALVEDSYGLANSAVCDGYSQAYVYLLQQAGIEATVIVGYADSISPPTGGHAWNVVKLDDDWYEVDVTWDDAGGMDETAENIKESHPYKYSIYNAGLSDPDYRYRLEHRYCFLTTEAISDFEPDESLYYTVQGHPYTLASRSFRERAGFGTTSYGAFDYLMKFAPIAEGVKYRLY